ncbi:MAG: cytochrome c3 family protein [Candidatus Latescibacterota bacterium]
MGHRLLTVVLGTALVASLVLLLPGVGALRLPGVQRGYEPAQPIAYSHRLHAGELEIPCLYCHFGAETSRHAGIPPASVCMNCHSFVTAPLGAVRAEDEAARQEGREPRRVVSPELAKLYAALGLGEDLKPDPARQREPIAWVKVHNVPDFVSFDHRPHVAAQVACQTCHGPVESMERVRQVADLTMGWCIACHRDPQGAGVAGEPAPASTDCAACHY